MKKWILLTISILLLTFALSGNVLANGGVTEVYDLSSSCGSISFCEGEGEGAEAIITKVDLSDDLEKLLSKVLQSTDDQKQLATDLGTGESGEPAKGE